MSNKNRLILIERNDAGAEHCWGCTTALVINVTYDEQVERCITERLLTGEDGTPAYDIRGDLLTREQIEVTELGKASAKLRREVILVSKAET